MVTAAATRSAPVTPASKLPGRRFDHVFFSGMAGLMLVTVFVGFAHTYYFAGVFHAPLPNLIIHIHGAAFSCWMLLLVAQTTLVSSGRVDIHRRLGIAGFLLACAMVVLGVMAATDSLVREAGPVGRDVKFFYIIPMTSILMFATLIVFAFRARSNPPEHKRLILAATISLMVAAIARWPFAVVYKHSATATLFSYIFLLLLMAYDLWSTHKVHRATLWATAFIVFVTQVRVPIGQTAAWHAFAGWVQHLAR
jgi:FtsH-binding integral membrane protein